MAACASDSDIGGRSREIPGRGTAALAESTIVATALEIIRAVGVGGLTMRELAGRLEVSVGAVYKHVPNKEALLVLAARELFLQVEDVQLRDEDGWLARIRTIMLRFYDVVSAYPGMASYLTSGPDGLSVRGMTARINHVLEDAGFSEAERSDLRISLRFLATGALLRTWWELDRGGPAAHTMRDTFRSGLDAMLEGFQVSSKRKSIT